MIIKEKVFYSPFRSQAGLAIIRVIVGGCLIFHGLEVFDHDKMKEYAAWDVFREYFSPKCMVYLGKGSELLTGLLLTVGFLTRLTAVVIVLTFLYITFFVGNGKFWYEDQHPFLFALLALIYFFTGPGKFSIDHQLFEKKQI